MAGCRLFSRFAQLKYQCSYCRKRLFFLQSFQNLHVMLHEATACHVSGELLDVLSILLDLIRCIRMYRDHKDSRGILLASKDWLEVLRKLASLLNTYNPPEMRMLCIGAKYFLRFFLLDQTNLFKFAQKSSKNFCLWCLGRWCRFWCRFYRIVTRHFKTLTMRFLWDLIFRAEGTVCRL